MLHSSGVQLKWLDASGSDEEDQPRVVLVRPAFGAGAAKLSSLLFVTVPYVKQLLAQSSKSDE